MIDTKEDRKYDDIIEDEYYFQLQSRIFSVMRRNIRDFWYLEQRAWFVTNRLLQNKLLKVIGIGYSDSVRIYESDFENHLDDLIASYYESKNDQ